MDISDYSPNTTYNSGDIVWFKDINGSIWLLRCIRDNNTQMPATIATTDNVDVDTLLGESGWHNENEKLNILHFHVVEAL